MSIYAIVVLLLGLSAAVVLFLLVRSEKLRESYVWLWLVLDILLLVSVLALDTWKTVANWLGFILASNMLLTAAIFTIMGVILHITIIITKIEKTQIKLTQEISLLNQRIDSISVLKESDKC